MTKGAHRRSAAWVLLLVLTGLAPAAPAGADPPRHPPRFTALAAAAGEDALVWVTQAGGADTVVWQPLSLPGTQPRVLWRADGWIDGIQWLPDQQLLVMVRNANRVRWYRIQFPGGAERLLLSESARRRLGPSLLRVLPGGDLLLANDRAQPWRPDLVRLSSAGKQALVERNPGDLFRWHPGPSGQVLLARRWRMAQGQPRYEWVWRPDRGAPWEILRQRSLAQGPWRLLGFSEDSTEAWFSEQQTSGYRVLDLASGALGLRDEPQRPAQHDDRSQPAPPGEPQPLSLVLGSRLLPSEGLDRRTRQDLAALGQRIAGRQVFWLGRAVSGSVWQLGPDPAGLQIFTVNEGIARRWPGLEMGPGHPVAVETFTSRDGQPVEVFVTRPPGRARSMVLLIHGGPWSHDRLQWHAEAQWLADRGHLVLQVNFRGSTNRGSDWQWAGRRQWSGAMLDDLEDAVRWARQRGLPGSRRSCAMGSSFGGYAALMLAARPDPVTRCTVARAPVTDLPAQIRGLKAMGNERGYREWREMVGDPDDPELRDASPVHLARRIAGPLLLAHGDRDMVVDISQSRQLMKRRRSGQQRVETQWLVLRNQGHDLRGQAARQSWYDAVGGFLDRSLADDR